MPVQFKIDILAALKDMGYSNYMLRKDKLLGEGTIQALRTGTMVSVEIIGKLCELLQCQPGDILEYISEGK